jgi:pimeloyl-ACP methyl ester carboxylesterase
MTGHSEPTAAPSRRCALQLWATALAIAATPSSRPAAQRAAGAAWPGLEHRTIRVNGVELHVAVQGAGPLVLLCHGWPELWYAWRYQIPALAAAGYRAAALDLRGFGASGAPAEVDAYTIMHLVGDVVGLIGALGERQAVVVGHDWGAAVAWQAALFRPDLVRAVAGMSVPFLPRSPAPPIRMLRDAGQTRSYLVYFQEPGVAEAELERDPAVTLRRLLYGGSGEGQQGQAPAARLTLPPTGGFLDGRPDEGRMPSWLTEQDLAYMTAEYRRTGFRGGLSLYRNIDRNWELTAPWQDAKVHQPALFVAGSRDGSINTPWGRAALQALPSLVPGLRRLLVIEGAGHWIQQERPEEVSVALVEFLRGLPG